MERQCKYTFLDKIGSGTYGTIYRVQSKQKNDFYAVKENIPTTPFGFESVTELDVLSRIQHPNLLSIQELILPIENCPIKGLGLVIPLATTDLFKYSVDYRKRGIMMPENQIYKFMYDICSGLYGLVQFNMLHLDITPSNILLSGSINNPSAVLLADFGLALYCEGTSVFNKRLRMTSSFRAPEIFQQQITGGVGQVKQVKKQVKNMENSDDYVTNTIFQYGYQNDIFSLGMVILFLTVKPSEFKGFYDTFLNNAQKSPFENF
jgi:serine/threonine protein kinase